ncbi:conserved hypothetical protein [Neospora caninum Liverpool]|uniref:Hook C-terminal domain-containing protein n=1 Tax=Neospora caninum (strain Liverpool) TaxID=572307 RepID=F0VBT8_NEOCL|nr:conserved hypothetical protein [Neospora caninum Liverpool]CBZ51072.1 conserved hypothetical protein [Neospora caninum Liverpool]|eukprot:XP_003881105.1 conserved hypothetical protein [Neospora caninum Liverpool]
MSFTHAPLLDTDACLEFLNSLDYGKEHPVHELHDCATAEHVWGSLHEIYPAWFDESLHPSKFANAQEALSQILYYLDEFHENKYSGDFNVITEHLDAFLKGDPSLILKTYEFILLATVNGDCQQIIAKIMTMSQPTQAVIQAIIQQYAGAEMLSRNASGATAPRREPSLPEDLGLGRTPSAGGGGHLAPLLQKVQEELSQIKAELRKTKIALTESESQRETLSDKLQVVEKERDEEKTKRTVLEQQLAAKKDVLVKDFTEQIEDSDKQRAKLKEELENEKKERKKVEEKNRAVIAELKEEMDLLKQEARRVSTLEVQVQNYKTKLTEVAALKEKMTQLELQNKAYMDRIVEGEADSVGALGLRKQIDTYKERVAAGEPAAESSSYGKRGQSVIFFLRSVRADVEERLSTMTAEKEAIANLKEEVEKQLSTAEKKLEVKELEIAQLQAKLEAKDFEISSLSDKIKELDKNQGRDVAEELAALAKENKAAGLDTTARIAELTNEVDDLKRVKQRLEKNAAAHVAQIAFLQKQLTAGCSSEADAQKMQDLVEKVAKQEEEIKQLRESKDDMAKQMMEALSRREKDSGVDETAAAKVAILETQLEFEKKQASMREDIVRAKVEKEMENVQSTLKSQLQLRERESNFYRKAVEENADSSKKEMRLLSSVLYDLGLRFHRLQAYCDQLKNENEAIQLRVRLHQQSNSSIPESLPPEPGAHEEA